MSSAFDPISFLSAQHEGANATKIPPVPIGEYSAQIDKVEYSPQLIKKGERAGQTMHKVNLFCKLIAPGVDEADGKIIRYELILEMTPSGAIDMAKDKNVRLGRLREALDMNSSAFSFAAMQGRMLKASTTQDQDPEDPEMQYSRIKTVARLD